MRAKSAGATLTEAALGAGFSDTIHPSSRPGHLRPLTLVAHEASLLHRAVNRPRRSSVAAFEPLPLEGVARAMNAQTRHHFDNYCTGRKERKLGATGRGAAGRACAPSLGHAGGRRGRRARRGAEGARAPRGVRDVGRTAAWVARIVEHRARDGARAAQRALARTDTEIDLDRIPAPPDVRVCARAGRRTPSVRCTAKSCSASTRRASRWRAGARPDHERAHGQALSCTRCSARPRHRPLRRIQARAISRREQPMIDAHVA